MTGFDGGFFGLPFTCECRIYGETQGRKNCSDFEKKITKSYLLDKIKELEKENEELKRERDSWKSSTCSYMNNYSVLSMDCQIVQEALWELEKEIEFGSKREDLFFDLKEKFEKLNNHRIGVF